MSYSNMLAERMIYLKDEKKIEELLTIPYRSEWDEKMIQERIEMFTPEKMIAVLSSKQFESDLEANPERYQTEKWYQRKFAVDDMSKDFLKKLNDAVPEKSFDLDYPPKNEFIPNLEDLHNLKVTRKEKQTPKLILEKPGTKLFFKQDDTFDQPLIYASASIYVQDAGYPKTTMGYIYASLWNDMFYGYMREDNYMASLAGIQTSIGMDEQ